MRYAVALEYSKVLSCSFKFFQSKSMAWLMEEIRISSSWSICCLRSCGE